jgi:3-dehydroquinate synthase
MAYSATLANLRGLLSDQEHKRLLDLFSRAGLSMDHHQFDEDILDKGTKAILKTRDGKLRAAVPSPLGKCVFLNDVSMDEMFAALKQHKQIMKNYPRNGEGLEAFVDASDTGYTLNNAPVENHSNGTSNGLSSLHVLNDDTHVNGMNGHSTVDGKKTNGVANAEKHASRLEGLTDVVDNAKDDLSNGVSGHRNGIKVQG